MVKCETAVNHNFQQEIASRNCNSSSSILTLNNEIALSPIEKKTWVLSEEDSTVSYENENILEDVHYVHELPLADEERLEKLFNQLDRDGNGKIDVHDLSAALKEFGLSSQYAEVLTSSFIEFFSLLTLEFSSLEIMLAFFLFTVSLLIHYSETVSTFISIVSNRCYDDISNQRSGIDLSARRNARISQMER